MIKQKVLQSQISASVFTVMDHFMQMICVSVVKLCLILSGSSSKRPLLTKIDPWCLQIWWLCADSTRDVEESRNSFLSVRVIHLSHRSDPSCSRFVGQLY